MGLISSCLWTGLTVGRVGLGFVTGRFKSLKGIVMFYLFCGFCSHILFWSISGITMSYISIFTLGFFIGPMFPSAMIMATIIMPKRLHVPGICAASALSGVGAASFPAFIGYVIEHHGAQVLPPIIFSYFVLLMALWISLPTKRKR